MSEPHNPRSIAGVHTLYPLVRNAESFSLFTEAIIAEREETISALEDALQFRSTRGGFPSGEFGAQCEIAAARRFITTTQVRRRAVQEQSAAVALFAKTLYEEWLSLIRSELPPNSRIL